MPALDPHWQGSQYHRRGMAACKAILDELKASPEPDWIWRRNRGAYVVFRGKWGTLPWAASWWEGDTLRFTPFFATAAEAEQAAKEALSPRPEASPEAASRPQDAGEATGAHSATGEPLLDL